MPGLARRPALGVLIFPIVVVVALACAYGISGPIDGSPSAGLKVLVFLFVLSGWVVSLCLHEFAHSVVALAGGDTSVRARGYLTLNPLRYTNPTFSLVIPLILLAIGGVPLPGGSVLIESHRLRNRAWNSAVSLAGPLTNVLCGVLLTWLAGPLNSAVNNLGAAISFLALLQFVTAVLNILPIPGFDGWGIWAPWLPASVHRAVAPIRQWAGLIAFALIFAVPPISQALFSVGDGLFSLFGGDETFAAYGSGLFSSLLRSRF